MIQEKLSEKDVELMGYVKSPVFFSEVLFTNKLLNHESLKNYSDDSFAKIRLYQLPYMSYEYLLADDPELSDEENFANKASCGRCYAYTGRKTGKTLIALLVDLLLDTIHHMTDWITLVSAFDEDHVANICEPYISACKSHPFFKLFQIETKRKPYRITTQTGHLVKGVNMNLSGREQGSNFESQHACKIVIDEHQYETQEVVKKRSQATSEFGTIERFVGITAFTKDSPAGNIFFNLERKNWLVNLPQTVSDAWTPARKQEAIDDYGDESSPAYKIHVGAEVIEDMEGVYDIERLRKCYYPKNKNKPIKHFEFHKDDALFDSNGVLDKYKLERKLIIERPANASMVYQASDFGENVTEIIIIFELEKTNEESTFKYEYNISLYKLTPDEQTEIFKYVIGKLQVEYTGIDCSDSGGKQIYRNLNKVYEVENLEWVNFQSKVDVDIKKDEKGHLIKKGNEYEYDQEFIPDWSIARLKKIFYEERIDCLYDLKLDKEFNNMICIKRVREAYKSKINQDHLHQAFQVFAIMEWKKTFAKRTKPKKKIVEWGTGVCSN